MRQHNIGIIGTGNVAWHMARALENAGHLLKLVYNRDAGKAREFVKKFFHADFTDNLDFSQSDCGLIIMAVSDDAIEEVAANVVLPPEALLVHTSGTVPLSKLGFASTSGIGVFYPLQTFSKGKKLDFEYLPICVEGDTSETTNTLMALASSLSKRAFIVDSTKRRSIHLAAVFACNFTNHLFTISKNVLEAQGLDFEMLHPLIAETLNKSLEIGPEKAQTGPAIRGDMNTLDKHYEALKNDPDVAEIYRSISQHILDFYDLS